MKCDKTKPIKDMLDDPNWPPYLATKPPPSPARVAISAADRIRERKNSKKVRLCCDCKHSATPPVRHRGYQPNPPRCYNRKCYEVIEGSKNFDYFSGSVNQKIHSCDDMRRCGPCGHKARYFEPNWFQSLCSWLSRSPRLG